MAAPVTTQSVFRHPLSSAFAGEGGVRLLRELSRHGGPLSPRTLADRTALTVQGVRRALKRLVLLGVVETIGSADRPLYQLTPDHPLGPALGALFTAEAARPEAVFRAVREAAGSVHPPVIAAWAYGSVARAEDTVASDLDIAVVFDVHDAPASAESGREADGPSGAVEHGVGGLRDLLAPVERRQRVTLSLVGLSLDDVVRLSPGDPWWASLARDAIPLVGPAPSALATRLRARRPGHAGPARP